MPPPDAADAWLATAPAGAEARSRLESYDRALEGQRRRLTDGAAPRRRVRLPGSSDSSSPDHRPATPRGARAHDEARGEMRCSSASQSRGSRGSRDASSSSLDEASIAGAAAAGAGARHALFGGGGGGGMGDALFVAPPAGAPAARAASAMLQDALFVGAERPRAPGRARAGGSAASSGRARGYDASLGSAGGSGPGSSAGPLRTSSSGWSSGEDGSGSGSGLGSAALGGSGEGDSSDESREPTRHLWIGNLGTRTPRAALKAAFDRFGAVDDVVTFPGRMYAFVNFRDLAGATAAVAALQGRAAPELTGDRRMLLKFRPTRKAAAHLRAPVSSGDASGADAPADESPRAVASPRGAYSGEGSLSARGAPAPGPAPGAAPVPASDLDRDGNCAAPSPRIWLGNIAPTATGKVLQAVLGRFGPLADAAVFPARIGPLGYAFVKFEALADAAAAFEALNNRVVPPLSGSKQLKMRYKPAGDGPAPRAEGADAAKAAATPSRHLWLGNVTQKPPDAAIAEAFGRFGAVESVRVFPAKAYAFVNFAEAGAAARAMAELDGAPLPALTGVKPLVMRFQQEGHPAGKGAPPGAPPPLGRVASDSALALAAAYGQLAAGLGTPPPAFAPPPLGSAYAAAGWAADGGAPAPPALGAADALGALHRSQSMSALLGVGAPAAALLGFAGAPLYGAEGGGLAGLGLHAGAPAPAEHAPLSGEHLTSLLSNLAALRAASLAPPAAAPPPPMLGLEALASLHAPAAPAPLPDIGRLSSMLAAHSLSPPPAPPPGLCLAPAPAPGTAPPAHLRCPLSARLMTDPVVAADGVTYERGAIAEWAAARGTSPVTLAPLVHVHLEPNEGLRAAVVAYLRAQVRGA
jgi:hypothetical protein